MNEREIFIGDYNVPRGTVDKLDRYAALLEEWQAQFNLVGKSTLPHIWSRHFSDSAQLACLAPPLVDSWLDLGSGAGFPGLVVALLRDTPMILVDAVAKKCRFLEAVIEAIGLQHQVTVSNLRVEAAALAPVAVISARAFAPLDRMLDWSIHLADRSTLWLLPKGEKAADEIAVAQRYFTFKTTLHLSKSDARGTIVMLTDVERMRR